MVDVLTASDSYKFKHWDMLPKDTEYVYSYYESRVGAQYPTTSFIGLQPILRSLAGIQVTREKIDRAEGLINAHIRPGTFNRPMWEYILEEHRGMLPIEIKAVPEGLSIPVGNVMMTAVNTDPRCPSLTNYLETLLSQVWYPSTVATKSKYIKGILKKYLKETSLSLSGLPFMLHDFGFRGATCLEAARIGGSAHLSNFMGTDTFPAVEHIMENYGVTEMPAYSVWATEHSIMTAEGEAGEKGVFKRLLDDNPTGILSVVIDSYNYKRFISEYALEFKDQILSREGKLVFRPDSGEPRETSLDVMVRLNTVFGSTGVNKKGFRVLNEKVGMLWGDGVDTDGIEGILKTLMRDGWAAENIVFGMGGHLLQTVNRDTQRNAFKSSAQCRSGVWHDVQKNPLDKSKVSKAGRLALTESEGHWQTVRAPLDNDILRTVFKDGKLFNQMTWNEVRKNAERD